MPRLEAELLLKGIEQGSASAGNMKKHDFSRYLKRLKKAASGGRRRRARKLRSHGELSSMNIRVSGEEVEDGGIVR